MGLILVTIVAAILYVPLVGLAARRVLGSDTARWRIALVAVVVFGCSLPFTWLTANSAGLVDASGKTVVPVWVWLAFGALTFGWVFAIGVALLVAAEGISPSHTRMGPISTFRSLAARRRRTRRYLQIVAIASKHGLGGAFQSRRAESSETRSAAQQRAAALVAALNEAGVTFVKFGQVLSTRRDVIPQPYVSALTSLQSAAAVVPWHQIKAAIESELGGPLDGVYARVDERPLAAASVAQVHTGALLDGTEVVIKVQRPTARAQVEADVDIVVRLARRLEDRTDWGKDFGAVAIADGFTRSLQDELDYRVELANMDMLATVSARSGSGLTIPRAFPLASGPRLLTMDRLAGIPLASAGDGLQALPAGARRQLAATLLRAVMEQILVHGVFHADLHPGNVLLQPDGSLALIDFGAVGVLDRSTRRLVATLLMAVANEDDISTTDTILMLVRAPEDTDTDALRREIGVVLTSMSRSSGGGASVFNAMLDVIRSHHMALPAPLVSAFRTLLSLEGCLALIDPDFEFFSEALSEVPHILREMVDPKREAATIQARGAVLYAMASRLPGRLETVTEQIVQGRFAIRLHSFGASTERGWIRELVSELVGAVIAVAAIVVAAVLVVSDTGPYIAPNVRTLSFIGAVVGLFGFLLILRAVRRMFRKE